MSAPMSIGIESVSWSRWSQGALPLLQQCLAGRYNLCPDVRFFATPPIDGSNQPARRDRSVLRTRRPRASPLSRPRWLSRSQWACGQREKPPSVRVIACWSRSRSGRPVRRSGSPVLRRRTRNHHRRQRLPPRQGTGTRPRHQPGRRTAHRRVRRPSRVLGAQPALTSGIRAMAPAGRVALVGMGADSVSIDVPIIQGREADDQRRLPLREHLSAGTTTDRLRRRERH